MNTVECNVHFNVHKHANVYTFHVQLSCPPESKIYSAIFRLRQLYVKQENFGGMPYEKHVL